METILFYLASAVAVAATVLVVTGTNAPRSLVSLVVSLLAVAVAFYLLGAPFAAVLQVVIYAGAIMVLFLFVVMMLNLGGEQAARERSWLAPRVWILPGALALVLFLIMAWILARPPTMLPGVPVGPKLVGVTLFTRYVLAVELAAMLLLAALVGAFHLGRRGVPEGRDEAS